MVSGYSSDDNNSRSKMFILLSCIYYSLNRRWFSFNYKFGPELGTVRPGFVDELKV